MEIEENRNEQILVVVRQSILSVDKILYERWMNAWKLDLDSQDFAIELCELRGAREALGFVKAQMPSTMAIPDLEAEIERQVDVLRGTDPESREYRQLRGRIRGMKDVHRILRALFDQAFPLEYVSGD